MITLTCCNCLSRQLITVIMQKSTAGFDILVAFVPVAFCLYRTPVGFEALPKELTSKSTASVMDTLSGSGVFDITPCVRDIPSLEYQ